MHGSKPRVWMTGQALGLHASPAIAGQRANNIHTTGVSNPDHQCSVARQGIRGPMRDANAVGPMPSSLSTFSESLHMV